MRLHYGCGDTAAKFANGHARRLHFGDEHLPVRGVRLWPKSVRLPRKRDPSTGLVGDKPESERAWRNECRRSGAALLAFQASEATQPL